MSFKLYNLYICLISNVLYINFLDSLNQNRTVHWKDSCHLYVPLYYTTSLKAAPLDFNIFQKVDKISSTTEIQVLIIILK